MEELLRKINSLGWYGGKLDVQIGIQRAFEGFSGKASETWETQYTFKSNEIKGDGGNIYFPKIDMKSKSYEIFEDFIQRVKKEL